MSKTTKHQATHDYLEGKDVGKSIWGILRYFNRCNFPKGDISRIKWFKHKSRNNGIELLKGGANEKVR